MKNFLAHSDEIREQMLESISVKTVEELFSKIPQEARVKELNLPEALSEMQVQKNVKSLAKKNNTDVINFLGAGAYNHFIPACIGQIAQRFEFLTAYTPYQPEISQGTLQIMYEFQSMICNLTGMDVSNASVYDGATACAEAISMSARITKRYKALVSDAINPEYKEVIKTYTDANGIKIEWISEKNLTTDFSSIQSKVKSGEYACILLQTPNFYGSIEEVNLVEMLNASKTLLVACVDISSLAVLKAPVEYGADIVVGDIQPLGIPMSFGGPHGGFMACREKLMRQLPGRIAGKTLDAEGNQAFTLTIQTREQHIKREKATSNICSNQALVALCATLYLTLLGEKGFKQVGILSSKNAHMLSEMLSKKGIKTLNKDFYNEFVIEVSDADKFLTELKEKNIIGGLKIDKKRILVATTEMNSDEELKLYCK
ncbi:MAG: aminomethyl-transferring glycine dehydrogenase subunit GcvPA [Candidatus Gastranaerophilales bacterium]|nr:aminomethyl-transferring glycine dehydrogenase subunit GcvPA [Candidatus Gastranaerophilales bacterium]